MKQVFLLGLIFFLQDEQLFAQNAFTANPDSAQFVTEDIPNFWKAFDMYKNNPNSNPFGTYYIEPGSAGVKGFIPMRIESAENLYRTVKKRSKDYEAIRENSLKIANSETACRKTFHLLKEWYSEAVFPPVYFIIGAFNSGGTSNEDGLLIGVEKQNNIENIPHIVAHELIHFQQKSWPANPTLLEQSITEGTADFLGELISGKNINIKAMEYGNAHTDELCREFVVRMDKNNYKDWLYQVSGKDKRPNDLGYWMGYMIAAQYFNNSLDKKKAIQDMLDVKVAKDFLKKSGFLDKYLVL